MTDPDLNEIEAKRYRLILHLLDIPYPEEDVGVLRSFKTILEHKWIVDNLHKHRQP